MADNVVNSGIEDVLSSIKRLVSEEDRKIPSLLASTKARKPGKLVLTDALRVGEATEASELALTVKEKAEYRVEDSVKPMLLRASDVVKHAEPAAEQQEKPEPKGDLTGSLSAKIEALEAAIARTEDQWEPDGDSDDAYSGTPVRSLDWNAKDDVANSEPEPEPEPEPELEPEVEIPSAPRKEDVAEDEPEPEETFAMATFIRDPDVLEFASSEPAFTPEKAKPEANDDEALRNLIAQVVREELQGVLGERITRNLRKMVRREIYRALAERKLD